MKDELEKSGGEATSEAQSTWNQRIPVNLPDLLGPVVRHVVADCCYEEASGEEEEDDGLPQGEARSTGRRAEKNRFASHEGGHGAVGVPNELGLLQDGEHKVEDKVRNAEESDVNSVDGGQLKVLSGGQGYWRAVHESIDGVDEVEEKGVPLVV